MSIDLNTDHPTKVTLRQPTIEKQQLAEARRANAERRRANVLTEKTIDILTLIWLTLLLLLLAIAYLIGAVT